MSFAVRYYTKTGNTKRLADAIAKELGVEALPIVAAGDKLPKNAGEKFPLLGI